MVLSFPAKRKFVYSEEKSICIGFIRYPVKNSLPK